MSLPSRDGGILLRSRKAEVGSAAGGILVERGISPTKLLWVFSQLKVSNTLCILGLSGEACSGFTVVLSVSIGILEVDWDSIVESYSALKCI